MSDLQNISPESYVAAPFGGISQPATARFFAHLFSVIFHPLFIPVYAAWYLAFIHPGYFTGLSPSEKTGVLVKICINIVFFPLVSVLLLKGVGFINSVFLRTQRDRIIPYIISNIFFFWLYLVFRNLSEIPAILTAFIFNVFLSSSIALLANVYFKISMHAIGAGGLVGLFLVILKTNPSTSIALPFATAILIAGIICTSRMIVSNHSPRDIYAGLFCGLICQLAGAVFLL